MQNILPPPQIVAIGSNGTTQQIDKSITAYNTSRCFCKQKIFTEKRREKFLEYISTYKDICGGYFFTSDKHLKFFIFYLMVTPINAIERMIP